MPSSWTRRKRKLWQIARAGLEIKSSLGYLVLIPENVSGDGVQAHRLRHLDTVPPILFRIPAGMNLARAHLKRFPVEQEIIRAKGEDMLGLAGGCGNGGTKNERTAEGDVEKCFHKWAKINSFTRGRKQLFQDFKVGSVSPGSNPSDASSASKLLPRASIRARSPAQVAAT